MRLYLRQTVEGVVQDERAVDPPDGLTASRYLEIKAQSHTRQGWDVVWSGDAHFDAVKIRWRGVACRRTLWIA